MPRLYVLGGADVGRSFEVAEGAVMGRSPDCAVVLRDRSISRHHARLERRGEGWWLVDQDSRNGVFAGHRRVSEVELIDLDEFQLGELLFRFRTEEPVPVVPSSQVWSGESRPDRVRESADELVLEGEELLDRETGRSAGAPELEATARVERPASVQDERARLIVEMRRQAAGGWLTGDLEQRPAWVRALLVALVLAISAATLWLAFRGTLFLRDASGG